MSFRAAYEDFKANSRSTGYKRKRKSPGRRKSARGVAVKKSEFSVSVGGY